MHLHKKLSPNLTTEEGNVAFFNETHFTNAFCSISVTKDEITISFDEVYLQKMNALVIVADSGIL